MTKASVWLSRHKRTLIVASVPILVAIWWAFRPEKLWINKTVNEPAPFYTSGEPQPIFTGHFDGKAGSRVTVFKKPGGEEYLRLGDMTTPDDADAHVELSKSGEVSLAHDGSKAGLNTIDLGQLKSDPSDQNYHLPAAADLTKYNAVAIYNKRTGVVFRVAKLEPF